MAVLEMKPGIFEVGAGDWDRRLFDELIPLPDGTSYNSYLIKGSKKTALIDTVDPSKEDVLLENLSYMGIKNIDFVIANHAEQDHSGCIPLVLTMFPKAKVVTNKKCMNMLKDHLHIEEKKFKVVEDGEELSLGDKTLQFHFTPWVHWPETMVTLLKEDKVLFSCDFFGAHTASSQLFKEDDDIVYQSAKRYYAEIMMPFRSPIKSNLKKLKKLEFDIIAPSHGPVYEDPDFIIDAYSEWVSDEVKNEVIVPYISMHGSTSKMVTHFVDYLIEHGMKVTPYNLTTTDVGNLAMGMVDAATIVLGTPTVLVGPHPQMVYATSLVNALRPKTKFVSVIGSYGWGGRAVEVIQENLTNLQAEMIEPVMVQGHPTRKDMKKVEQLAEEIIKKHKEAGLF